MTHRLDMKHRPRNTIRFSTQPMLSEPIFRDVVDRFLDDHDDIDVERIKRGFGYDDDIDIYDLVLDYLFEYKYIRSGFKVDPSTEYRFVWKDRETEQTWENCLEVTNRFPSEALAILLEDEYYGMLNEWDYNNYPEFADPEEIDEEINEYLLEKAMEED